MPAKLLKQNREIKEEFYKKIAEKQAREKEIIKEKIDDAVPGFLGKILKPAAEFVYNIEQKKKEERGDDGEFISFLKFFLLLPSEWRIINDVVLEPVEDEFIQIDHLMIGPLGIFLIETKNWRGAILAKKDEFLRKENNKWVKTSSPIKQNYRHQKLFGEWLKREGFEKYIDFIFPVVLFVSPDWLKTEDCTMPVFDSGLALSIYLRGKKENYLSISEIENLANRIINAKPFTKMPVSEKIEKKAEEKAVTKESVHIKPTLENGKTKDGREYMKIRGTEEIANLLRERYIKMGKKVSSLYKDKYEDGAWFFYYE